MVSMASQLKQLKKNFNHCIIIISINVEEFLQNVLFFPLDIFIYFPIIYFNGVTDYGTIFMELLKIKINQLNKVVR